MTGGAIAESGVPRKVLMATVCALDREPMACSLANGKTESRTAAYSRGIAATSTPGPGRRACETESERRLVLDGRGSSRQRMPATLEPRAIALYTCKVKVFYGMGNKIRSASK